VTKVLNMARWRSPKLFRSAGVLCLTLLFSIITGVIEAPAQVPPPCSSYPADSPQACNVLPLDAPRPAPIIPPLPPPDNRKRQPYRPKPTPIFERNFGSLPLGMVGQEYQSQLLGNGLGQLRVIGTVGRPLPWLKITPEGRLSGIPSEPAMNKIRLRLRDSARPGQVINGIWQLQVVPVPEDRTFAIYSLSSKQLEKLDKTIPLLMPSVKPSTLLAPIASVEYPSRALFDAAMRHYLKLTAAPGGANSAESINVLKALAEEARRPIKFRMDKLDWNWTDDGSCRCVRPLPSWGYRTIYGFMPSWRTKLHPGVATPNVDFSLFDRIGLVGVQIGARTGNWIPGGVNDPPWSEISTFARTAQAHGTELDLVLEGSDWSTLPEVNKGDYEGIGIVADIAAAQAVGLTEAKLNDSQAWLRDMLAGFWNSPKHVFNGITVMFRPPPIGSPDDARFRAFFERFIPALIGEMRRTGRPYTLNIVMDDSAICKDSPADNSTPTASGPCKAGAFALNRLLTYRKMALEGYNPKDEKAGAKSKNDKNIDNNSINAVNVENKGATKPEKNTINNSDNVKTFNNPIDVNFLVMIKEPTREGRKNLQSNIDIIENVSEEQEFEGNSKHEFLRAFIPIFFGPGTGDFTASEADTGVAHRDKVESQAAYGSEYFGGVGFWPVPNASSAASNAISTAFFKKPSDKASKDYDYDQTIEEFWCSLPARLVWQLLLILSFITAAVYFIFDINDRQRRLLTWSAFGFGTCSVVMFFVLLYKDPALYGLRLSNTVLISLVIMIFIGFLIAFFKPSIRQP
jgi:hypothetical protein